MTKEYTEKQMAFVDALFTSEEEGGAEGNPIEAKRIAGYSDATPTKTIIKSVKDLIYKEVDELFEENSAFAAFQILDLMKNPNNINAKTIFAINKEVLDRAGHMKTEKVQVEAGGGLFILPKKEEE